MKDLDEKRAELLSPARPKAAEPQPHRDELPEPPLPGAIGAEALAHPANAAPVADLFEQLQESRGNAYVQAAVAQTAARPLDAPARAAAEAALGDDLGDVRLHTGAAAANEADRLGARAFTRGSDIYFGPGEYHPETRGGQELLAHELAHVVQQRGPSYRQGQAASRSGSAFEHEAERVAPALLAGQRVRITRRAVAPSAQRKEKEEVPSIMRYGQEIGYAPPAGTIDASGHFTVAYFYNIVTGADTAPLTLAVPAGMAVGVVPLTDLGASDYRVVDAGAAGARAVTIAVSTHLAAAAKIQVTLTQGSFTCLVVFQFPQAAKASK